MFCFVIHKKYCRNPNGFISGFIKKTIHMKTLKNLIDAKQLSKKEQQAVKGGGGYPHEPQIACRTFCPPGESCRISDRDHCYSDGTGA